jgi:5-methylcytosine-specific restriction endonuclease McrA
MGIHMKLTSLKPRIASINTSRVQTLQSMRPGVVERKRGSAGVKDREMIKHRDCGMCQSCGRLGRVVDHIDPLWAGGSDDATNKQLLCDDCHDTKTKREATQRAGGGSNFREAVPGHRAPSHADKKFHF